MCPEKRRGTQLLEYDDIVRYKSMASSDERMGCLTFTNSRFTPEQDAYPRDIHAYSMDRHFRRQSLHQIAVQFNDKFRCRLWRP
ncbi:hypothetical protein D3C71_1696600 [compost metagenome]